MRKFSIICDVFGIVLSAALAVIHCVKSNEDAMCGFICAAIWAVNSLIGDVVDRK